jgi:hypothetical protein
MHLSRPCNRHNQEHLWKHCHENPLYKRPLEQREDAEDLPSKKVKCQVKMGSDDRIASKDIQENAAAAESTFVHVDFDSEYVVNFGVPLREMEV